MSVRRWVSAGAVGLLGLGMGLHPATAPAAQAAVSGAVLTAAEVLNANRDDPVCYPRFTGARPGTVRLPADGVRRTIRLDRHAPGSAHALRSTAVVSGRVSGDAWGTTRVRMWVASSAAVTPRAATGYCSPTLRTKTEVFGDVVTVARPSWVAVRGRASNGWTRDSGVGFVSADDGLTGAQVRPGRSLTRLIGRGDYTVGGSLATQVHLPLNSTTARSSSASANLSVSVYPIGTRRKHAGKARRFVQVGHRNCTRKRVRAELSPRLRKKANRVTFYVNGKRRTVLTGRELRRKKVVLKRIPARSNGRVDAVVVKKSGARLQMKATSWPCKA